MGCGATGVSAERSVPEAGAAGVSGGLATGALVGAVAAVESAAELMGVAGAEGTGVSGTVVGAACSAVVGAVGVAATGAGCGAVGPDGVRAAMGAGASLGAGAAPGSPARGAAGAEGEPAGLEAGAAGIVGASGRLTMPFRTLRLRNPVPVSGAAWGGALKGFSLPPRLVWIDSRSRPIRCKSSRREASASRRLSRV